MRRCADETNPVSIVVIEKCWCLTCGNSAVGSSVGPARWRSYSHSWAEVDSPWVCADYDQVHWSTTGSPPTLRTCSRGPLAQTERSQPHLLFYFHYPFPLPLLLRGVTRDLDFCRFCSVWKENTGVINFIVYFERFK